SFRLPCRSAPNRLAASRQARFLVCSCCDRLGTQVGLAESYLSCHHLSNQTIGKTSGHPHVNIAAERRRGVFLSREIQSNVLRSASDDLASRLIYSFNHYFICVADLLLVVSTLDF